MYKEKRVMAIIPARGGSKGIHKKNIVDLGGHPLIYYTLQVAKESMYIDKIVVSTDSKEIAKVVEDFGIEVPFLRPKELSLDTSKSIEVVKHAVDYFASNGENYDIIILLQPTSPFRTVGDVDGAIDYYFLHNEESLVSVSLVNDHPLLIRSINKDGKLENLLEENSTCRRQDMPLYYVVNGSIYINKVSEINNDLSFGDNVLPYIMDKSHSIDIDDMDDLMYARYILNNK